MTEIVCSGALFYAKSTKRFMLVQRANKKHLGQWGIVGGKAEGKELPVEALKREISEEIGDTPTIKKFIPLEMFTSTDQKFFFNTYVCVVETEFVPVLNGEHIGYCWVQMNCWPKPMHQGLLKTVNSKTIKSKLQTILDIIT